MENKASLISVCSSKKICFLCFIKVSFYFDEAKESFPKILLLLLSLSLQLVLYSFFFSTLHCCLLLSLRVSKRRNREDKTTAALL